MATNKCWGLVILAAGVGFWCGLLLARTNQQKMKTTITTLQAKASEAIEDLQEAKVEIASLQDERDLAIDEFKRIKDEYDSMIKSLQSFEAQVTAINEKKKQEIISNLLQGLVKGADVFSLAGLEDVVVSIFLGSVLESYGLTEQTLQNDIELKLRQNGIKVIPMRELYLKPLDPILDIAVFSYRDKVDILISLRQMVALCRDPTIFCVATTWNKRDIFFTDPYTRFEDIREEVKNNIDEFINDYLTANPKK